MWYEQIEQLGAAATGRQNGWSSLQLEDGTTGHRCNWTTEQLGTVATGRWNNWALLQLHDGATEHRYNWTPLQLSDGTTGRYNVIPFYEIVFLKLQL